MGKRVFIDLGSKQAWQMSLLRTAGFACNRTWICLLFFSPLLFSALDPEQRWLAGECLYLGSVSVLAVSLAVFGFLHARISAVLDTRFGFLIGPGACLIAMLAIAQPIAESVVPAPAQLATTAIGTGIGSSLVLLDIGRSYRTCETRTCSLEILGGTAIAAIATAAAYLVPATIVFLAALALPFCAEFCAHHASKLVRTDAGERKSRGESLPITLLLRFGGAALILGAATGFMRDTYSQHSADAFGMEYGILFMVGTLIAVLLLVALIMTSKSFSLKLLYNPVVLVCTTGFALLPSFGVGTTVPYLLVTIGYTVFEIIVWIALCDMANRFQYTFVQVLGIGRSVTLAVGVVAGGLLARLTSGLTDGNPRNLVFAAAVAVGAIAFSHLYIFTERNLDEYDSELHGTAPSATSSKKPLKKADASTGDAAKGKPEKPPLFERCRIIGTHYGLSRREIDVFHLLVLGRSAARIQEELMIAAGTVNTHTYHIYTKLDVHSQQELIDLMLASNLDDLNAS